MATVASRLRDVELPDAEHAAAVEGPRTRLGALWESSPAALVFLRHYG